MILVDDGTLMVYLPLISVTVPTVVPFTTTFAPITGCFSVSITVPVTVLCAKIPDVPVTKSRSIRKILRFFSIDN
jgi:hypothetical protein